MDFESVRKDFPTMRTDKGVYLDSSCQSLRPDSVIEAVTEYYEKYPVCGGRSVHHLANEVSIRVDETREALASFFNAGSPNSFVFTKNSTEALNTVLKGYLKPGMRVVTSSMEHNAVTRPLHALGAELSVAGRRLFDPEETLRAFSRLLPGADAAVCTQVSNVFGYVLPIREIAELCKQNKVPLIVDASQAAGLLDVDLDGWGAAFVAMPGHKGLFGPQGTGLLLCGERGEPLLYGGSGSESRRQTMPEELPERLEAGTMNVCGIAGLLAGLRYVREKGTDAIFAHERRLLALACEELSGSGIELFTGAEQAGVLSLRIPGIESESVAQTLGEHGICVRAGLHCAPLAHESAGTLETGTVRLSFSPFVTEGQLRQSCGLLRRLAKRG